MSVICTLQLILKGETVKSLSSIQPKLHTSLCLCVEVCACIQYMRVRVYVCNCHFVDQEANTTCRMLKDQSALVEKGMSVSSDLNTCIPTHLITLDSVKHSVIFATL